VANPLNAGAIIRITKELSGERTIKLKITLNY
jgi:hypothetical protein